VTDYSISRTLQCSVHNLTSSLCNVDYLYKYVLREYVYINLSLPPLNQNFNRPVLLLESKQPVNGSWINGQSGQVFDWNTHTNPQKKAFLCKHCAISVIVL